MSVLGSFDYLSLDPKCKFEAWKEAIVSQKQHPMKGRELIDKLFYGALGNELVILS